MNLTETCRCPLCHEDLGPLQPKQLVCCETCNTPYHLLCYRELGGCATLGCANRRPRPTLRIRPPTRARRRLDPQRPETRRLAVIGLVAILLILGSFFYAVHDAVTTKHAFHAPGAKTVDPGITEQMDGDCDEPLACAEAGRHRVGCRHAQSRPRFALTAPVDDRFPDTR